MADQLSPGVVIRELDLTGTVPVVGISGGATVFEAQWGPVEELTRVATAKAIEETFGKPTDKNHINWFSAANFLAYTGDLTLVRVVDDNAKNATDDGAGILIKNDQHFQAVLTTPTGVKFAARYPGAMGDSIAVSMADSKSFDAWDHKDLFDTAPGTSQLAEDLGAKNDEIHVVVIDKNGLFTGIVGSVLESYAYLSKASNGKDANYAPSYYVSTINAKSKYVYCLNGETGTPGQITTGGEITGISVTAGGSSYNTATVDITGDGTGATAEAVIGVGGDIESITITNPGTGYTTATITINGDGTGATATATTAPVVNTPTVNFGQPLVSNLGVPAVFNNMDAPITYGLTGGKDSTQIDAQELIVGYNMLANAEEVDVGLIFVGDAGGESAHKSVIQHVIDNVIMTRRDCMLCISPKLSDVLNKTQSQATANIAKTRNDIGRSNSFTVMDTGWKVQYDVYNDKYRHIPLNADLAGLMAQASNTHDDWWSPAGYTRGKVKNVINLVFNPDKQSRDALYKIGVNPVVTFKVDGTILYGDKTLQGKASAFQQIGVRRLFIRLQKAISSAAKYLLFEFNDELTRATFRNMVTPYLREVQGRRGMHSFAVICDETNNTPEVIMKGEFVGSIFVKLNYSIQWVRLDFVAVRRDVEFKEVTGQI